MYDWETKLTSVGSNRVVRPLDWGIDWTKDWPCRNGCKLGELPADSETYLSEHKAGTRTTGT
jgi:hypothetical protein